MSVGAPRVSIMTTDPSDHVRPTRRALADLGMTFPSLTVPLHTLDHSLIQKAQRIPSLVAAGGGERVVSLTDRVWFKVKVDDVRTAATNVLSADELTGDDRHQWWLGACGRRHGTSADDFYAALHQECRRAGKGEGDVAMTHLLPQPIDEKRFVAEKAALVVTSIRATVREAIALRSSLTRFPVSIPMTGNPSHQLRSRSNPAQDKSSSRPWFRPKHSRRCWTSLRLNFCSWQQLASIPAWSSV
jgi:hypothetical protein